MALKFGSVLSGAVSQFGWGDFDSKPSGVVCNWGKGTAEAQSVIFSALSTHRGIKSLNDGNPSNPGTEMQGIVDKVDNNYSGRMHRDLASFPSGLPHFLLFFVSYVLVVLLVNYLGLAIEYIYSERVWIG